jgi:hypothetical protein
MHTMTAQWTNLDKGTWDSVYANGDGIKVATQRRTPGQLWERLAEEGACTYEHGHNYDDATGERYCELPSQATILYGE